MGENKDELLAVINIHQVFFPVSWEMAPIAYVAFFFICTVPEKKEQKVKIPLKQAMIFFLKRQTQTEAKD